MQRLCVYALIFALALATFSEASWKPHTQRPHAPLGTGANRDLEQHWLEDQGPASHHRRQLGRQGPPHLVAGRSCSPPCLPHPARFSQGLPRLALTLVPGG
uniref:gastrin n=1 Tax=Callithrix jacchus TaxID=9483 RepID=UPI00159F6C51|nr:gastrin [Callithrix jacchus]